MSNILQMGDIIELNSNHCVYAMIPKHFAYSNCKGDWDLVKYDVSLDNKNFAYLQGKYVVIQTKMTGGGTGHGPHDVYPDGHYVTCKNLKNDFEVSFYQTGCFNVMNPNIVPIGKATQSWDIPKEFR